MPSSTLLNTRFTRSLMAGILLFMALVLLAGGTAQVVSADPLPPINFGVSQLSGHGASQPTSLQFGPDERLYILQKDGIIRIMEVTRSAANTYSVVPGTIEIVTLVNSIPNHDDDGSLRADVTDRQTTGMTVVGTAENPVIYVTSSDPRSYVNLAEGETVLPIDTNSGIISRLTWNGTTWSKVDLVRGLPRSAEYHATNGVVYDAANNQLFIASGGNTNMGAPDSSLSFVPEYALSSSILVVDLNVIQGMPVQGGASANPYIYDIPTLDDDSRANSSGKDVNDPWGGNKGKNQARIVVGGPVQVFSPGYRNPYDVTLTEAGRLYTIDNGPNAGFGRFLKTEADQIDPNTTAPYGMGACLDDNADSSFPAGYTGWDNLHLVTNGFYGGHPNAARGNINNTFNVDNQTPVTVADAVECDFRWSGDGGNAPQDGSLAIWGGSTNGITEYTATNFAGQMQGNLLATSYASGGTLHRVVLNTDGTAALSNTLFANQGGNPLDIIAQSDFDVFAGTVWSASFWTGNIFVYEPADYGGTNPGTCDPINPGDDSDGDGFTNQDEADNNTAPCNTASKPHDNDDDHISDLNDPDDDNDTLPDTSDPFATDGAVSFSLPVNFNFDPAGGTFGTGIGDSGFTGLMTNGTSNYQSLYNLDDMTIGGIAKLFVVDNVTAGTALGGTNNQDYAFQLGLNTDSTLQPFTYHTRIMQPYFDDAPQAGQEIGLYIGNGDQDNYLKLVLNSTGFLTLQEVAGVTASQSQATVNPFSSNFIDLYLSINPATGIVTPRYGLDNGSIVNLSSVSLANGATKTALQTAGTPLAAGFISTTGGAASFTGIWDLFNVQTDSPSMLSINPTSHNFGTTTVNTAYTTTFTLQNMGIGGDPAINISSFGFGGSTDVSVTSSHTFPIILAPQATVQIEVTFTPTASGVLNTTLNTVHNGVNNPLTTTLTGNAIPYQDAVVRINSGGPELADTPIPWAQDTVAAPSIYLSAATSTSSGTMAGPNTTNAPSALFNTERWNNNANVSYSIPNLAYGTYEVRLYFAEICWCGFPDGDPGDRKFHINIDGVQVATNFDQYDEAQAQTGNGEAAIMRPFSVIVNAANPAIDIQIVDTSIENASLKGLEVVPVSLESTVTGTSTNLNLGSVFVRNTTISTLTLKNPANAGSSSVVITGLNIPNNVFTIQNPPTLPVTLEPQETLDLTIAFQPLVTGTQSTNLVVTHDGAGGTTQVALSGTGDTPGKILYRVNAGGAQIAGTPIPWGEDRAADNARRAGTATVGTPSIYLTSGEPNHSAYGDTLPGGFVNNTGAPNELFSTERWDGASGPDILYTFPAASQNPNTLPAGNYEVRLYLSELYYNSANSRKFDIYVQGVQVEDEFDVFAAAGNSKNAVDRRYPVNLAAPGTITVSFDHGAADNPAVKGIEIVSTDPIPATLSATPSTLTFPPTDIGQTSPTQSVVLKNEGSIGSGYIEVNELLIDPEFIIVSPASLSTLDPQESVTLEIAFRPITNGNVSKTLSITHNATNTSPLTLDLGGVGQAPSSSLSAPASLNFGNQNVPLPSTSQIVTLVNLGATGDPAIQITGVSITGANPGLFSHNFTAPFSIAQGGTNSTSLSVTFTPDSSGAKSATLVITHNGDNSPTNVTLSGTGVVAASPYVTAILPANGATNVSTLVGIAADVFLPNVGQGVDATTLNSTNVRLFRTSDNAPVAANYNTSGGADVIVAQPINPLQTNTNYTFQVTSGVKDISGAAFLPFTSSFTTGSTAGTPIPGVEFDKITTAASPNFYTSLVIGPDTRLYASSIMGTITRWDIDRSAGANNGTLKNEYPVIQFADRAIVGMTFAPGSTATDPVIWVTHNHPNLDASNDKHFTGAISKIVGANVGTGSESWTRIDYVVGLPRSVRDHMTNGIIFGPDGNMYMNQGSISAMGARDNAWGQEPETVLSAATLKIDVALLEAYHSTNGVLNVATGVVTGTSGNETLLDVNNYGLGSTQLLSGTFYNPQAANAPITIYGSGVRNAYDLVWHSNGNLYAPANGSAAGGATPATPGTLPASCKVRVDDALYGDYTGPAIPAANPTRQNDYLFRVVEGGFYGHPNPTRCEWVMNGGNPTSSQDYGQPDNVNYYPVGTLPDRNYRGFAYDFLNNKSPDGAIEYQSNTFGGALKGYLIVTRYSVGKDLIALRMGADGNVDFNSVGIPGFTGFSDPLDVTEDTLTGNLYVSEAQFPDNLRITLLRPKAALANQANITVSPMNLIFNQVAGGPASAPRTVTITNTGNSVLNIGAYNIAAPFEIVGTPATTVLAGQSIQVNVVFHPTVQGPQGGSLTIFSNDPQESAVVVTFRGLGTAGTSGAAEPSLQWVVDTYNIPVNVGDDNPATNVIHSSTPNAPLLGQELPIPIFEKAGAGQVTLQLLGVFGPNTNDGTTPVVNVGWYGMGNAASKQPLFSVNNGHNQSLNAATTGVMNFDPGSSAFGFYSMWPFFSSRELFSEDALNTFGGALPHHVRVYPLRDSSGIVANAYIITFEEHTSGNDFQDVTFIAYNVKPAAAAAGVLTVSPNRLIFSDVINGGPSASKTVTLTNEGVAPINIFSITTAAPFEIVGTPATTIAVGASIPVQIRFNPTVTGPQSANLTIISNAVPPSKTVELRGLGTAGNGGNNEPSLQWILDTYNIGVSVGDDDAATTAIHSNTAIASGIYIGDEVRVQEFEKSGTGPVTLEPLATYAVNGSPIVRVGWNRIDNPGALQEVFSVNSGSAQTLTTLYTGSLSFDPGAGIPFSMYALWVPSPWNGRVTNTRDSLNNFTGAIPHHARIFPLKDSGGTLIPNSYIVAYEENTSGYDYNDIVYIVRNVKPSAAAGAGITFENLDWHTMNGFGIPQLQYLNRWLSMQRINLALGREYKDEATLRISNTGVTPLTINSINITNTNKNVDVDGNGNPNDLSTPTSFILPNNDTSFTIPAGGYHDLVVRYVASYLDTSDTFNHKGLYYDMMTINSDDLTTPNAQIQLVGIYNERPEDKNEVYAPGILAEYGFTTNLGHPFSSEYQAVGDEILSPNWTRMLPNQPIYVRQLAAMHGGGAVTFQMRNFANNTAIGSFAHDPEWHQSILPPLNGQTDPLASPAEKLFTPAVPFRLRIAGYDSNVGLDGNGNQHAIRFWPIRDPNGDLVPGAFFIIQDYVQNGCGEGSANCDYNDNVYIMTNVQPSPDPTHGLTFDTDLQVSIDPITPVLLNDNGVYNVTVENLSYLNAPSSTLTFNLPANATFVSAVPSYGTCQLAGSTVQCSFGDILGETSATVAVTVTSSTAGNQDVSATVATTATETNYTNNSATAQSFVLDPLNPPGSLVINKIDTPETLEYFNFSGDLGDFILTDSAPVVPSIDVSVNFQTNLATLAGYDVIDNGPAFSDALGHGWRYLATGDPVTVTANASNRGAGEADKTLIHMQRGDCCATGVLEDIYWEYNIPNGIYAVTVAVGDPSAKNSKHVILVEGQPAFNPELAYNSVFHAEDTVVVEVTDGRLTIAPDPVLGVNTKIKYVHIVGGPSQSTITFPFLMPGTYSVYEEVPLFWQLDNVTCTGANTSPITLDGGAGIVIAGGENVVCTYHNSIITGPSISLDVTPAQQQVTVGGDATFNIEVTNNGTVSLSNVAVVDGLAPDCDENIGTLASLATHTYTCTVPNVVDDFTNIAQVVGTPAGGPDVSDDDEATVEVVSPGLVIDIQPDTRSILSGGAAVFNISVENTGTFNLNNVTVSDPLAPDCDRNIGTLIPGQVSNYSCSLTNVTSTFTNVATASAELLGGNLYTTQDTSLVAVTGYTYGTPVFRINAGGAQIAATEGVGFPNWLANTSNGTYNNTGSAETGTVTGRHYSVPDSAPQALFNNSRWDGASAPEMQWNLPVPSAGLYEVRLYFANICSCTSNPGQRVFDVSIEGNIVLDNYDIADDVGDLTGVMKAFIVNTDTNVDVDFFHVTENPVVSAIEIIPLTPMSTSALGAAPGAVNFGTRLVGTTSPAQTVTLTNLGLSGANTINITAINVTGNTADFSVTPITTPPTTLNPAGTTSLSVTFTPQAAGTRSAVIQVSHNGENGPTLSINLTGLGQPEDLPDLVVNPTQVNFTLERGNNSGTQTTQISSTGDSPTYTFDLTGKPAWIKSITPVSGTAPDTGSTTVTVEVDTTGLNLPVGIYQHVFTATSVGYTPATLVVHLQVILPQYTLSVSQTGPGVITPIGTFDVNEGASQLFTITPNTGNELVSLVINGTPVTVSGNTYNLTNILEDKVIVANFAAIPQYNVVTSAVGSGTIAPAGTTVVTRGDNLTVTVTPDPGFIVSSVTVNGTPVTLTGNTYDLTNIQENKTVVATFVTAPIYDVTGTAGANGTITPSGTVQVTQGNDVAFTFTPNTGYAVDVVLVNGAPVVVTGNAYTLTNVQADTTVEVSFKSLPVLTINVVPATNGTVTPNGSFTVFQGDNVNFTFTPNAGYEINSITANGLTFPVTGNAYTLTNVLVNTTVIANFTVAPVACNPISSLNCTSVQVPVTLASPYCLNWNASEGGLLSGNSLGTGFTMVDPPSSNLFPAVPSNTSVPGYEPGNLTVNTGSGYLNIVSTRGIAYRNNTTSTNTNSQVNALGVGFDATVRSEIRTVLVNPNITTANGEQGGIWFGLNEDNYVKLVVARNAGQPRVQLMVETLSGGYPAGSGAPNEINVVAATMNASPVTLRMVLDPVANTVTGYYQIGASAEQTVGTLNVLSTFFTGVTLPDGLTGPMSYTGVFTSQRNNTATPTLNINFDSFCVQRAPLTTRTITATAGLGGSISPAGSVSVADGDDQTFTFTPDTDYAVADVVIDGVTHLGPVASYTFTNVTADHTIDVSFMPAGLSYTITPTVGPNGTATPNTPVNVPEGHDVNFTITPDAGYLVDDVVVDGVSQGAVTSYSFTNVTADHTIDITFREIVSYTITATAGVGGSITPNGAILYTEGTDVTYTITTDVGYTIEDVVLDGISQGAITSVPFTNLNANHTIDVTFDITCSPISQDGCNTVPVSIATDYCLDFNGTGAGILDKNGLPTGFMMVSNPSVNQFPTPAYDPTVPGYEPQYLNLTGGELVITSTRGIMYEATGGSTNNNNQVNALGVGVNVTQPITLVTSVINPHTQGVAADSAQAGVWFGLDEDNYVKAVIMKNGNVQLLVETLSGVNDITRTQLDSNPDIAGVTTKTVYLYLVLDPTASTATVQYSIDAGANKTTLGSLPIPDNYLGESLFDGRMLSDGLTGPVSFAGIFASARNYSGGLMDFRFGNFCINPQTPATNTNPNIVTNTALTVSEGLSAPITSANLQTTDAQQFASQLLYTVNTGPTSGTLNLTTFTQADINNNLLAYTHNGNGATTDSFTFTVSDGAGGTANGTFNINITQTNDAPVQATNVTLNLDEATEADITTAHLEYTDEEQGAAALVYTVTVLPANGTLFNNGVALVLNDTFTQADINGGLVSYLHDGSNTLIDSFDFTVTDGVVVTPMSGVFNITINDTNGKPVAAPDAATVAEGGTVTVLTGGATSVLANDSDPESEAIEVTAFTQPTSGTSSVNPDGTFSYTHNGDGATTDSFTYTVTDASGGSSIGTVTITITQSNDTPVAVDDAIDVAEGGTATTLVGGATSVLANDTDEETLVLTVSSNTNPTNGTVTVNADGTFSYTHNGNGANSDSFTYTISDGAGGSDTATVTIAITQSNDNPVAVDDAILVAEGGTATTLVGGATSVLANDSDEESPTLSAIVATGPTSGTLILNPNGTFSYTHDGSQTAADSFTYTVSDGSGGSAVGTVNITISIGNDIPTAVDDAITVAEGGTATTLVGGATSVLANDTDEETLVLTVSANTNPANGTVTVNSDGTFSYTHDGSETTTDSFTYTADDGNGGTAIATVTITITPVNDNPVATDDEVFVSLGGTTTTVIGGATSLLANDTDAENDTLTVTGNTNPTNGTVTVNSDGTFSYTHDGSATTTDSFTYTISDGNGGTAVGTVNISVNEAPVAVDDAITVAEGGTATTLVGGAASVLANDTDPDADTLEALTYTQPVNGTLTFNIPAGTFSYTHDGSETTTDSFTYTVGDGKGGEDVGTVSITITPVNDNPVAVADTATVAEGGTVAILDSTATSVLANDTDAEGNSLTVTGNSTPANGTVTVNTDGTFSYTHNGGETTTDSFTYSVSDGNGGTATGTVNITITPVNDAPVAADDTATATENTAVVIPVLTNDTDVDNALNVASVVIVTAPANGTAVANANGTVTYTPSTDYFGGDSFTYTVNDASGTTSNVATVTITVNEANDAPVANNDTAGTFEDTAVTVNVLANDTVNIGSLDTSSVVVVTAPLNGTTVVNANGTIKYTPNANFNGSNTFTYTVKSNAGITSNVATVTITIIAVNDAPVLKNNTGMMVSRTATATINNTMLLTTDADNSASQLLYTLETTPQYGALLLNGIVLNLGQAFSQDDINNNRVAYAHNGAYEAADSFSFMVTDDRASVGPATFNITVTNIVSEIPVNLEVGGGTNSLPLILTYTWTHISEIGATEVPAEYYHLVITNANGVIVVDVWVPASEVCNGVTCSFVYVDKTPPYVFEDGTYTWYVEGWVDPDGDGVGEIVRSEDSTFVVNVPEPNPQGPQGLQVDPVQGRAQISWDDDPGAMWYYIWIGNASQQVFGEWISKADTQQMHCDGTRCWIVPNANPLGGTYDVWMQSWAPDGSTFEGLLSGWQGPVSYTLPSTAPSMPSSLQVNNADSGRPVFTWEGPQGVTWYNIWVGKPLGGDLGWETYYYEWHLASDFTCVNAGTCTFELPVDLGNGSYQWALQGWGPGGFTGGGVNSGWVGPLDFNISAPAVNQVNLIAPDGLTATTSVYPTFTWNAADGASWYEVYVGSSGQTVYQQWYRAADLGCAQAGTICSLVISNLPLPNGYTYDWTVQPYSPAGMGAWASTKSFSTGGGS